MKDLIKHIIKNTLLLSAPLVLLTSGVSYAEGESTTLTQAAGNVDGYEVKDFDDFVDFGLVLPVQGREGFFNFSMSSVLSSKTDTIRPAGQRLNIPSNISLPSQKENYIFVTVRFNKPKFTLPFHGEAPKKLGVLEGRFPFERTVEALRGGAALFSVVNWFEFRSHSVSTLDSEAIDFTTGQTEILSKGVEATAPECENSDYITLGVQLSEVGNDEYFPIDIKVVKDKAVTLKTDEGQKNLPVFLHLPKSAIESASSADALSKPFPYSMVWGENNPEQMLPLGETFITRNDSLFTFSPENVGDSFSVLGYKVNVFDKDGVEIFSEVSTGKLPASVNVESIEGAHRLRIDTYAIDRNPIAAFFIHNLSSASNLPHSSKYITRYEIDL